MGRFTRSISTTAGRRQELVYWELWLSTTRTLSWGMPSLLNVCAGSKSTFLNVRLRREQRDESVAGRRLSHRIIDAPPGTERDRLTKPKPGRITMSSATIRLCGLLLASAAPLCAAAPTAQSDEWPYYGHDAGGTRFSPLTQINRG